MKSMSAPRWLSLLTILVLGGSTFPGNFAKAQSTAVPAASKTPSADVGSKSATKSVQAAEGEKQIAKARDLTKKLSIAEWLGPLAPVALSPFFGLACLSGLSLYGPASLKNNILLGDQSLLCNPTLFWVFVGLTVLTSLPRLTKVSKPLAQLGDQLEAYAGVITMLVIKFMTGSEGAEPPEAVMLGTGIYTASVLSTSIDILLMGAAALNMLVINSVKFFCELAVWLIPVPTIDACFELANKTLCAALLGLYVYSPFLATVVNLSLLAVCLILLRWFGRSLAYFRAILMEPLYAALWPRYGQHSGTELIVYPQRAIGSFPAKTKLLLSKGPGGWVLKSNSSWFKTTEIPLHCNDTPKFSAGWIANTLTIPADPPVALDFSRRYQNELSQVAQVIGFSIPEKLATSPAAAQPA